MAILLHKGTTYRHQAVPNNFLTLVRMQRELGERTKPTILLGARMCEGEEWWGLSQALDCPQVHGVMREHKGMVARDSDFKRGAKDPEL